MSALHSQQTALLGREQFVRLPQPAGVTVHCCSGTLWITVDGENEDIELAVGASHTFRGGAPALVGALGAGAAATIHRPVRETARRWWSLRGRRWQARFGWNQVPVRTGP